ncbi:glycosyltransferase family 2 protein [Citrobacter sedlakii]|nr:glycosyltransferase family 2 protein [Citrobacter sedlakii]
MTLLVSVVTPTYNRAGELQLLFDSLNKQEDVDFEWIIIDDGSTDSTSQKIASFKDNNLNIKKIKYVYQSNNGKNSAVIKGIQHTSGEYIVIIDSDDYLLDEAFMKIKNYLKDEAVINNPEIIGISGVKVDSQMKPVSFTGHTESSIMSHYDWFYTNRRLGDRIDFYKASILKEKIFNSFTKEKFITEDALWLDLKGKKLFISEPLLVVKYMDGGLSSSYASLLRKNPFGTTYYYYILLINTGSLKIKFKASLMLMYYIVLAIVKNSNILIGFFSFVFLPLLCLIKLFRK